MKGEQLEEQMSYWKERLKGSVPVLQLPTDHARPPFQSFRGARHLFTLPGTLTDSLKALSHNEECTLFMTLTAAFNVLLYRYSGQSDITIGTAIHNRSHASLYDLIGFFANTVVLRTQMFSDWNFRQLLKHIREITLGAYSHQDVPFEKIVEALHTNRDPSYTPLFQAMFVFQNEPDTLALNGAFADLSLSRMYALEDTGTSKRDLTFYVRNTPEGMDALFEYDADLFEEDTIARFTKHFQTLLEEIVDDPDRRLAGLSMLDEAERHKILTVWNDTESAHHTELCVHKMFEARAEQTPDAVAIISEAGRLSYGELNSRANQLARRLKGIGVGPDVLVGICLERSLDMVIGILAILKARGAYVPMDPVYPKDRLDFMLEDAQASVLITAQRLGEIFNKAEREVILIDADRQNISLQDESNLSDEPFLSSLAYLIYTSGSTGISKGVMITHDSLSNYVQAISTATGITAEDRYLHTASFAFSSSVRQLMVPLSLGASSVIASSEQIADPVSLFDLCRKEKITVIDIIPMYWRSCIQALTYLEPSRQRDLLDNKIRLVLSASEPLNSEIPKTWDQKLNHSAKLINMFGQTETTGIVSLYKIPDRYDGGGIVSTGRPIANTQIYILDSDLCPVPVGVSGELHIGGSHISRGYFNRPGLTAEKFIPDRFSMRPGMRLYRTGDIGYYLPDGNIKFLGRIDHQVKVNGIRIELEEIEKVLLSHPSVRDAVVVARQDSAGNNRLVAYVVAGAAPYIVVSDLRGYLKQRLPEYMIPSNFIMLDELPLTPNGKLDRGSLPVVEVGGENSAIPFAPPSNSVEETVAKIWAEVLELEQVGVNHNFFELGGHSLSAMLIMSRLREVFKVDLPLRKLFDDPTIAGLALAISESKKPLADKADSGIQPLPRGAKNIDKLIMDLDHFSEEEMLNLMEQTSQDK
jgi:aspartate racemase